MQQIWNWGTIIFAIKQFLNVYLSVKKGLSLTVIAENRIEQKIEFRFLGVYAMNFNATKFGYFEKFLRNQTYLKMSC